MYSFTWKYCRAEVIITMTTDFSPDEAVTAIAEDIMNPGAILFATNFAIKRLDADNIDENIVGSSGSSG